VKSSERDNTVMGMALNVIGIGCSLWGCGADGADVSGAGPNLKVGGAYV